MRVDTILSIIRQKYPDKTDVLLSDKFVTRDNITIDSKSNKISLEIKGKQIILDSEENNERIIELILPESEKAAAITIISIIATLIGILVTIYYACNVQTCTQTKITETSKRYEEKTKYKNEETGDEWEVTLIYTETETTEESTDISCIPEEPDKRLVFHVASLSDVTV